MLEFQAGTSRRAFLVLPIAVAGITAIWLRKERALPDPASDGTGPPITLVLFSDRGDRLATRQVKQVVKTDAEWRRDLTRDEYLVTRKGGTETAYTGRYWNNHQYGIYRCTCCGSAVFRAAEKFDSDTGWPSFWAPAAPENVTTRKDNTLAEERVEVLCAKCGSHLGHVFPDGPPPTGLRYCLNSAALRFITRQ